MTLPSVRACNTLLFLGCAGLLGFGYFLQFVEHIEPCPLCIIQRVLFFAAGISGLLAALHNPKCLGTRVYALLTGIFAIAGAGVATRQVWLQHLPPDQVPECGPGLSYMLEQFSVSDTILKVFKGSGECAEVTWTFLSLSIAEWALAAFAVLLIVAGLNFIRARAVTA